MKGTATTEEMVRIIHFDGFHVGLIYMMKYYPEFKATLDEIYSGEVDEAKMLEMFENIAEPAIENYMSSNQDVTITHKCADYVWIENTKQLIKKLKQQNKSEPEKAIDL